MTEAERPATPRSQLRFGLMCRGPAMPSWQVDTLRRLRSVPGVRLDLLIVDSRGPIERGAKARMRRLVGSETTLWDAYNNGYVSRRARALARVDCSEELAGVERIEAVPELRGRYSEHFAPEVVDAIRTHDLDFILRFAYGIIRGDVLSAARYGIWSFHHGDEQVFRGGPPAFWEVFGSSQVSGVLLQRLTDRLDGGIVLRKGWFRTARHSYVANTDRVHFGGIDFPAQVCRDLLRGKDDYLHAAPSSTDAPIYRKPNDRTVVRFAARGATSFVRHHVAGVAWTDHWNVGLVRAPIASFLDARFLPRVEWFADDRGRDRYLADPFPARADGGGEVLAEDYDCARHRGAIALLNFEDMTTTPVDIGTDAHASYPFTLRENGVDFVVPQVAGQRDVAVASISGTRLQDVRWLGIDEEVIDPTVIEHEGRWWMFFTRPGSRSLTELHVWWSADLFGRWSPHARNPVKTDVRSARPAGTPFRAEGRLYRPAQDCSVSYGGGISLTRVDRLTPDEFAETVVRLLEPDPTWPYPDGMHTLTKAGDHTLIDAKRRVFNRHESRIELTARLARVRRTPPR